MDAFFGGVVAFMGLLMGALAGVCWQDVRRDWSVDYLRSLRPLGIAVSLLTTVAAVAFIALGSAVVLRAVL